MRETQLLLLLCDHTLTENPDLLYNVTLLRETELEKLTMSAWYSQSALFRKKNTIRKERAKRYLHLRCQQIYIQVIVIKDGDVLPACDAYFPLTKEYFFLKCDLSVHFFVNLFF